MKEGYALERLTSLKNPRVMLWRSLRDRKGRRETGLFLAEGRKMAEEALASSFPVEDLLLREGTDFPVPEGIRAYELPEHVFDSLCETKTPQGVLAVVKQQELALKGTRLVALDGVQDPGNVGTIIRTADAAGFDGVILSEACADPFSPKVLRSTMGSAFRLPVVTRSPLAAFLTGLKEQGWTILSSQLDGEPFFERRGVEGPFCLVIGSEGNGVTPEVRAAANRHLRLPMQGGAESLNAAIAAGIMMYDLMWRS